MIKVCVQHTADSAPAGGSELGPELDPGCVQAENKSFSVQGLESLDSLKLVHKFSMKIFITDAHDHMMVVLLFS